MRQFERHYAEIGPALRSYFQHQPALAGAAEDLLQETFLRAWRQRERCAGAVSVRAYLFGIARHVAVDAMRRGRRFVPLDEEVPDFAANEEDERLGQMRSAIASLPETHREPLRLKLQHELSYAEIAEVLDLPVGTIRSRLHYAVARLQAVMAPTQARKL